MTSNRQQWLRGAIVFMATVGCLVMLYISIQTIDTAVHGGNKTSAAVCLQVSKQKAEAARVGIATAITLNTLAIGIAILVAARAASCVCGCITWPEKCKSICNYIVVLLYITLVCTVVTILAHVDPSCHKLALAFLMLLVIVPITCCPIYFIVARDTSDTLDSDNSVKLVP